MAKRNREPSDYGQLPEFCLLRVQQLLDLPVKIGGNPLRPIKNIVLGFSFGLGGFLRDATPANQNTIIPEGKESVDAICELYHGEGVLPINQILDVVKVACDCTLQSLDLLLGEIILRNGNVGFQDPPVRCVLPSV